MLLNPYLYHRAISINTKNTTNDLSSLIPKNTWRTLSINLISEENYYQEEKQEIQEEKKLFLDNVVEDEEQSMEEEPLNTFTCKVNGSNIDLKYHFDGNISLIGIDGRLMPLDFIK